MRTSILKYIFYSILFFAIVSCNQDKVEEQAETIGNENAVELSPEQLKNSDIQLAKIKTQTIASILKVNGHIDVPPQNMISISSPLGGYLKSTKLLPGMHLRKGELIATMEDPQYITLQQEYLMAKSRLSFTDTEFTRQGELNQSKASSDKVFQESKMNSVNQKVLVKSLSEKLKLIGINPDDLNENNLSRSINIVSPIDGFVSKVNMNIGKYANPSDIIFELVNPTDIHLALDIFEKDVDKIQIGQKLIAYTNSNPDQKYTCEIILIGKNLADDNSVEVHCHFDKYDKSLLPGMFMNAEIEVAGTKGLVIPDDAIVQYEGRQLVFAQTSGGKYEMIEVKSQNNENGLTQISFVESTDFTNRDFVVKGAYTLLMKMKNTEEE